MVSALCGSLAYAEEVKAPNAIFRKVEDVLTPKQMEAAGIAAGKYIAVYPTQLSDPITKDGQYIIANNFGPEATKKAEKGEPIPYYLTSQYLKDHQNLLVPITKPASAPTAPAVTAQKPPAGTATDIVKPPKAIYGELVEVELGSGITVFVIRRTDEDGKPIMVPDPKNPGKMIFEDTTPFADIIPDPKNPGKFKFDTKKTVNVEPVLVGFDSFDELSPGDGVYYQRITDAKGNVTIKLINPSPPVDWDTPWYKNGKQVGIIEKRILSVKKMALRS